MLIDGVCTRNPSLQPKRALLVCQRNANIVAVGWQVDNSPTLNADRVVGCFGFCSFFFGGRGSGQVFLGKL